jgi:hypothetical protein
MEGYVDKRWLSTGGNGREAEAEKLIPGSRIIGTYGGFNGLYIVIYFTGAVRNENTSCKAFGSFLTSMCFEVFPE